MTEGKRDREIKYEKKLKKVRERKEGREKGKNRDTDREWEGEDGESYRNKEKRATSNLFTLLYLNTFYFIFW